MTHRTNHHAIALNWSEPQLQIAGDYLREHWDLAADPAIYAYPTLYTQEIDNRLEKHWPHYTHRDCYHFGQPHRLCPLFTENAVAVLAEIGVKLVLLEMDKPPIRAACQWVDPG